MEAESDLKKKLAVSIFALPKNQLSILSTQTTQFFTQILPVRKRSRKIWNLALQTGAT